MRDLTTDGGGSNVSNANVIASDTQGYDKVARLIGTTINKAFKDLFDQLTQEGALATLASSGGRGGSVTQADLDNFLSVLGGADLQIAFTPRVVKGTKCIFDHADYDLAKFRTAGIGAMGVEGSISIGVKIGF